MQFVPLPTRNRWPSPKKPASYKKKNNMAGSCCRTEGTKVLEKNFLEKRAYIPCLVI